MKYLKVKDINNRTKYQNKEIEIITLKFIKNYLNNKQTSEIELAKSRLLLLLKKTNAEKNRILRRCALENKNKTPISKFGISRMKLKELILLGMISGYQRAVW